MAFCFIKESSGASFSYYSEYSFPSLGILAHSKGNLINSQKNAIPPIQPASKPKTLSKESSSASYSEYMGTPFILLSESGLNG